MTGRTYLAWNMLAAAENQDERREQILFNANMRSTVGSPLENMSENNFIKLYRLNKESFQCLCELLRDLTDLKSTQRVSLESKVLCALLFYGHGDYQKVVAKANHFSQEAVSVYIQEVTAALNHPNILHEFIKFPTTREERDTIKQGFYNKYKFPGVIGCVDGSHFKICKPSKEEEQIYYSRKHYHSLNVQMICDSNCIIMSINAKYGGVHHDSFVWRNSDVNDYMQSLHRNNEIVWLLGDSGYPQRPWLMTPYEEPTPNSMEEGFNKKHCSTRVVIENTFGRLKNRWRCLHKDRTMHYWPERCAKIIIACSVLHNIALKYKVPDPDNFVPQDSYVRREVFVENERSIELLMGRALRNQLASRLSVRNE